MRHAGRSRRGPSPGIQSTSAPGQPPWQKRGRVPKGPALRCSTKASQLSAKDCGAVLCPGGIYHRDPFPELLIRTQGQRAVPSSAVAWGVSTGRFAQARSFGYRREVTPLTRAVGWNERISGLCLNQKSTAKQLPRRGWEGDCPITGLSPSSISQASIHSYVGHDSARVHQHSGWGLSRAGQSPGCHQSSSRSGRPERYVTHAR